MAFLIDGFIVLAAALAATLFLCLRSPSALRLRRPRVLFAHR